MREEIKMTAPRNVGTKEAAALKIWEEDVEQMRVVIKTFNQRTTIAIQGTWAY